MYSRIAYFLFGLFSLVLNAATTITVNVPGDASSAMGGNFTTVSNCDLRGALNYINTRTAPDTYTINFAISGVGNNTITLTTALEPRLNRSGTLLQTQILGRLLFSYL